MVGEVSKMYLKEKTPTSKNTFRKNFMRYEFNVSSSSEVLLIDCQTFSRNHQLSTQIVSAKWNKSPEQGTAFLTKLHAINSRCRRASRQGELFRTLSTRDSKGMKITYTRHYLTMKTSSKPEKEQPKTITNVGKA